MSNGEKLIESMELPGRTLGRFGVGMSAGSLDQSMLDYECDCASKKLGVAELGIWKVFVQAYVSEHLYEVMDGPDSITDAIAATESPIEAQFLAAVILDLTGIVGVKVHFQRWFEHKKEHSTWIAHFGNDAWIDIHIQKSVGDYRVDFLFECSRLDRKLVVECDGHDFHERTKTQASRDKARDRWFASCGMPVYRFSGSDIYADVFKCSEEVHRFLLGENPYQYEKEATP